MQKLVKIFKQAIFPIFQFTSNWYTYQLYISISNSESLSVVCARLYTKANFEHNLYIFVCN